MLVTKHHIPLSFIQAASEAKVSLDLHAATLRDVLDALVARAPEYRYRIIANRLVLFPREPAWEIRVDDLTLGPAPRLAVARDLARELSRREPVFAGLDGPPRIGYLRSFIYTDVVSVTGPGAVVELLVQLLDERPSAFFHLGRNQWHVQELDLGAVQLLKAIQLTAPATTLRHSTDMVQLKLFGTVYDGGARRDLTAGRCGTKYSSSNDQVLAVSTDGLVSVRGAGRARVTAVNEDRSASVDLTVMLPATQPQGAMPGGRTPARPWPESAGDQLLDRGVGDLSAADVTVQDLWASLTRQHVPLSLVETDPGQRRTLQLSGVSLLVQFLRRQECSPVSFIAAASERTVSLNLHGATVAEVLRQIASRDPAYRAEAIAGREVLYPAAPEFQLALSGIDIASTSRLDAAYNYLDRLGRDVPAFSTLAPPMVIGDSRHPIFSQKVRLRPTGRVIEHLVDLLGQNPELYFEFGKATSGVPELVFDMVNCAGSH